MKDIKTLISSAQGGDIAVIQNLLDNAPLDVLMDYAADICRQHHGIKVKLAALLEFSNYCRCNCLYCGLRRDNVGLRRFRLSDEIILDTVKKAKELGFSQIVLQSGEDAGFEDARLEALCKQIALLDMKLILSCGERRYANFLQCRENGAYGYLMRIETTNPQLYAKMHPGDKLKDRLHATKTLQKYGYYMASGSLIGLPEQTTADIATDIAYFRQINADFIGIGPLIPHQDTPLAKVPTGKLELALKVVALCRIICPDADIPATTAIERLGRYGLTKALQAGANMVLPNLTPPATRKDYEIFAGKSQTGAIDEGLQNLISKIENIGREVDAAFKK